MFWIHAGDEKILCMNKNIEIVQSQFEAYKNFDLESFCSYYHPEIRVMLFEANTVIMEGIEEFKEIYASLFKRHPHQKCVLKSRVINNDTVIDEEIITGRDTNPKGLHTIVIYSFRDNLIDKVWFV